MDPDVKQEDKKQGFKLQPIHAIAIVVILAIVGGAYYYLAYSKGAMYAQTVAVGDNVSVYYTGTFTNGTVFGTNEGQSPLNFTAGSSQLISGFDNAVIGMHLNETKNVTLPPAEAYGEINQSLIDQVPISAFSNNTVHVGMVVANEDGQEGLVTAIAANVVTVDFNPPLAGYTLIFHIRVVGIRK